MKRSTTLLAGTIGALALLAGNASAVPNTVSFTGRITQGGTPVADGTVNLSFELFTAATGGSSTGWTETHNSTPISNGLVYVQLGSTTGLTGADFAGSALYLEITVNGDVQSPRIPITSAPYAIRSSTSDTLGNLAPSDVALSNHNHDGVYAAANHTHSNYALTTHNHDAAYAAKSHTHILSCSTVQNTGAAGALIYATCPAGTAVTGGGCYYTGGPATTYEGYIAFNFYRCRVYGVTKVNSYAYCCKVMP